MAKMAIRAGVFLLPIPSPGAEEKALGRHLEATLPHHDEFLFPLTPLFTGRHAPPGILIPYSRFQTRRGRTALSAPPLCPPFEYGIPGRLAPKEDQPIGKKQISLFRAVGARSLAPPHCTSFTSAPPSGYIPSPPGGPWFFPWAAWWVLPHKGRGKTRWSS